MQYKPCTASRTSEFDREWKPFYIARRLFDIKPIRLRDMEETKRHHDQLYGWFSDTVFYVREIRQRQESASGYSLPEIYLRNSYYELEQPLLLAWNCMYCCRMMSVFNHQFLHSTNRIASKTCSAAEPFQVPFGRQKTWKSKICTDFRGTTGNRIHVFFHRHCELPGFWQSAVELIVIDVPSMSLSQNGFTTLIN